jgi:hypothetical protein
MTNNVDSLSWKTPFDPPPQKGPPPQIPLPKPPTHSQLRSNSQQDLLSPTSVPAGDEYFAKVNYSPSTPPRIPPKNNIRAPALHRLSETDSIEEADILPQPPFRTNTNESPVSPYTVVDKDAALPDPSSFDLDRASGTGRKGSASSAGTLGTPLPHRISRGRSLQLAKDEDDEPTPFIMKSDKHKRILGIDSKTPSIKRHSHKADKAESPKLTSTGMRRKRSIPDTNGRSDSPLPAPDVVPFLYQDIEVSPLGYQLLISRMCEDNLRLKLPCMLPLSLWVPHRPHLSLTCIRIHIFGTDIAVPI